MRPLFLLLSLCACAPLAAAPSPPTPDRDQWLHADTTWPMVAAGLPGEWHGGGWQIEAHLIANDSALVQTWHSKGGETMNVFHPDGDAVVLTHYCGQGNQSTLRATRADANGLVFEQDRVTNLRADGSALCRLELAIDSEHVRMREVYCDAAGTAGTPDEIVVTRAATQ